jgi:hypothetical protein
MAIWYRRYQALYDFEARSERELTMCTGHTLTVSQLADGNWPPPEKWMQGYNEVTEKRGEFPGGAYVNFLEEFVVEPEPPPLPPQDPEPPPPLPPQPSPRHVNSQKAFQLPGMTPHEFRSTQSENDVTRARKISAHGAPQILPDNSEEAPPPPPPRKGSDGQNAMRGNLPVPPKPHPRVKKVQPVMADDVREQPDEGPMHSWVSVTFGLPVQCEACESLI